MSPDAYSIARLYTSRIKHLLRWIHQKKLQYAWLILILLIYSQHLHRDVWWILKTRSCKLKNKSANKLLFYYHAVILYTFLISINLLHHIKTTVGNELKLIKANIDFLTFISFCCLRLSNNSTSRTYLNKYLLKTEEEYKESAIFTAYVLSIIC